MMHAKIVLAYFIRAIYFFYHIHLLQKASKTYVTVRIAKKETSFSITFFHQVDFSHILRTNIYAGIN